MQERLSVGALGLDEAEIGEQAVAKIHSRDRPMR
jgi:hypothetical protein